MPEYLIRHTTLRQLQIFEAIVRLGSFTRAAEELFLTQPTVSMQTKKLADSMGLPLFEQIGRNVRPTEAGEELYQSVRSMFQTLANLEMKMSDLKGIRRGRLRLGVITTAQYFTPEVLGEFCQQYPGIEVALKVSNRERVIERINSNEDDLYIMGQTPMDQSDIVAYPFAPNPMVVMARHDHPLVKEKNIPLSRIAEEPLILREPGSGIRDATQRLFEQQLDDLPRLLAAIDVIAEIEHVFTAPKPPNVGLDLRVYLLQQVGPLAAAVVPLRLGRGRLLGLVLGASLAGCLHEKVV